ncbi:hypothetical protein GHT06_010909 [Daphnia sinensis]|uniref:Uncharacterized protein n=1 Tax=Daphnia sinensis TaxID=1820382 RepID=A0AAD5PXD1_9CRUS|nr:hypothetical protein GHT06_010909 [Daphnia sinensis]
MLIGFTLIGLHAWSISSYSEFIDRCEWFLFGNEIGLCGRVAIDSLMICSGDPLTLKHSPYQWHWAFNAWVAFQMASTGIWNYGDFVSSWLSDANLKIKQHVTFSEWVPFIIIWIILWGGIYLVIFGMVLIKKKLKSSGNVSGMAVVAALIGITLIGLFSWRINSYQEAIANCGLTKICDRVAIDSLMIISGILAVIVNGIIATKASSFVSQQICS